MPFIFVLNPAAGSGRAARVQARLAQALRRAPFEAHLLLSEGPGHAAELARQAALQADAVVAVGGDGTVHEVAAGLLAATRPVPLGLVPVGSGNDFARALGVPARWPDAVQALASACPARADVGRVRWVDDDGEHEAHFVNAAGLGFDAAVALAVRDAKALPGAAGYLLAALRALRHFRPPHLHLDVHPSVGAIERFEGPHFFAYVGNGRSSGGGIPLTPSASVWDGHLDACLVRSLTARRVMQLIPLALRGRHGSAEEVHLRPIRHLRLQAHPPAPLHADGEVLTSRAHRVDINILPGGLPVLRPPEGAVRN